MAAPRVRLSKPVRATTPLEKLEIVGTGFRGNLEKIRSHATAPRSDIKEIAEESIKATGCPKKHIIASAFGCCDHLLAELYGPLRWRSSLSKSKVKTIVGEVGRLAAGADDAEWPGIFEFIVDFSASNRSLTEVIGKKRGSDEDWEPGWVFNQYLAVESELNGGCPKGRRDLACRDVIKLCLVQSELKVLVYPGDERDNYEQQMLDALLRTIKRCHANRRDPGAWLLIGLVGDWPDRMSVSFHVLNNKTHKLELKHW